jgi:hypothetical protein
MSGMIDTLIAYRILNMLTTPFNRTDAYRLGIIDAKGNLKKHENRLTSQERGAYTLLHRLVFRLKKILDRSPHSQSFSSLAAATSVIKDSLEHGESDTLEEEFLVLETANKYVYGDTKTFSYFISEDGGAVAAANSIGNGNVQGLDTEPVISKKRQVKLIKRNSRTAGLRPFK